MTRQEFDRRASRLRDRQFGRPRSLRMPWPTEPQAAAPNFAAAIARANQQLRWMRARTEAKPQLDAATTPETV